MQIRERDQASFRSGLTEDSDWHSFAPSPRLAVASRTSRTGQSVLLGCGGGLRMTASSLVKTWSKS